MKILKKIINDKAYLMQDCFKRYVKVVYRNDILFTQIFKGSKTNFYNVSKKDSLV